MICLSIVIDVNFSTFLMVSFLHLSFKNIFLKYNSDEKNNI